MKTQGRQSLLQSILDFLCLSFLTCFEFCVIINIMSIFRNLCFLLLILAVPSSAVEIAQPQPDLDYETVGLFHREISNKGCEKNTPGKVHRIPGFRFAYQQTDMCEYYYPSHTALAFSVLWLSTTHTKRRLAGSIPSMANTDQDPR